MIIDLSYKTIIEGLLFISDTPMTTKMLADILEIDELSIEEILTDLEKEYKQPDRGMVLKKIANGYQFMTAPIVEPYIKKMFQEKKSKLSNAAYETLSIIAYKQPVTRSQIDYIRGVKSDGPLQQLITRGLVEEKGRLEQPGRPIIFCTTLQFLVSFGLNSLEELPRFDECQQFDFSLNNEMVENNSEENGE